MKSSELRERNDADLGELQSKLRRDLFGARMKNFTGQLDDTSQLPKVRRDLARIEQLIGERKRAAATGSES